MSFELNKILKIFSVVTVAIVFLFSCSAQNSETQTNNLETASNQPQQTQSAQSTNTPPQPQLDQQLNQAPDVELKEGELQQFASAVESLQSIQQQAQQKMVGAIQDQGLNPNRYAQIMKSQQNPQSNIEVSDQERQQFQAAAQEIQSIQKNMRTNSMQAIQDEGLNPQRFQTILTAVRNDTTLQQQLQSMN